MGDFGLSRYVHDDKEYYKSEANVFPAKWTAPACVTLKTTHAQAHTAYTHTSDTYNNGTLQEAVGNGKSSVKSDVYSFGRFVCMCCWPGIKLFAAGVVLYEMVTKGEGMAVLHFFLYCCV